ncbi:putative UBA-like superfamily, Ubiquitin-associated domain-containing protein [Helianthus anomalus]
MFALFCSTCRMGAEFEAKFRKHVELRFSRDAVIQALKLFDGNVEQAARYLLLRQ